MGWSNECHDACPCPCHVVVVGARAMAATHSSDRSGRSAGSAKVSSSSLPYKFGMHVSAWVMRARYMCDYGKLGMW